jgi:TolB-like protein
MKFKAVLLCLFLALTLTLPSPSVTQTKDPNKVYKVAILPFMIYSQENLDYLREGIYEILTSRVTVAERIVLIERSVVERALYEERPTRLDETAATKIGMKVGADYIVLGSLTKVGNYISLDARLISLTEEKPPLSVYTQHKGIDDVMVKIGDFAQDIGYKILGRRVTAGRPGQPRYPSEPRRGIERYDRTGMDYKKSQTFGFEIKALDIGDVDGDKKNEVVIMDYHNLYVFKYDGEKLSLLQKIETGFHNNFLSLDVADVNRNGIAEIIVTSIVEDNLHSFILEFEEGKFKKITDKTGWFFRVLNHPKEGPILMGQNMGSEGLPVGPIYKFIWKKKSFEKGPKMNFPPGMNFPSDMSLYGIALANIRGNHMVDLVTFDELERLSILSMDGKFRWKSKENYGGTTNFYDTWKKKDLGYRFGTSPPARVYIPGRILVRESERDGVNEVIITKNYAPTRTFERIRSFDRGEIYGMAWDEDTLAPSWKTREIKGYIPDFQIKDADNDGNVELVVATVDLGGALDKKVRSNILFFELF